MASNEMIERVSEAIWQAEWARAGNGGRRKVPWGEIAPDDQDRYRFVAQAAIEAMREPTERMVDASYGIDEYWSDGPDHIKVYAAMIDAALTEPASPTAPDLAPMDHA